MAEPLIVIGNKRYSSWSLRGWLPLKHLGVPFREYRIPLYVPGYAEEIAKYSPAGKVPILVDGGVTVHDSLAIGEYVNEAYASGALLPAGRALRAQARSVCAEMHSGFPLLRQALPMNLARPPSPLALPEPARKDVARILALWEDLRGRHRDEGPYLFGAFSLADCMYLPVATRFQTYQVDLTAQPRARAYLESLLALPAFVEWRQAALRETEIIADSER